MIWYWAYADLEGTGMASMARSHTSAVSSFFSMCASGLQEISLWSIDWRRDEDRGETILSPGITSSSAPGFCLEGDMAGGLHPRIPVQYQVVWSDHQRFGRNTIWSWCQGSLSNPYVAASFLISRICGDIFVSCEWSEETASAVEGVIERGRWPLLRGLVRQSPELPLPLPGGSLVTWPGWKG